MPLCASLHYIVATEAIFEKPNQTIVGMIHAELTRTEKVAFH